ncbi:MAG: hypothetical protein H6Q90_2619 [Deltaproteobacteria bacterium]|nr:hypothetical protein [Deltaproteobacteria bacterium]
MVDKRWSDMWSLVSTADQQAKPLAALLREIDRAPGGSVAPQVIEAVSETDARAEAVVIACCSLPIDPVAELARLEETGRGDSPGAQQLRKIVARWDGRYERRPRTIEIIREASGWRVCAGWSDPR